MSQVVTAPLVVAYNEDGSHRYLYEGATVPTEGLKEGEAERLAADGLVGEVSDEDTNDGSKPRSRRASSE